MKAMFVKFKQPDLWILMESPLCADFSRLFLQAVCRRRMGLTSNKVFKIKAFWAINLGTFIF